jgi:hypothetical protein
MVGLAGIYVEVFRDMETRLAPVRVSEVGEMVTALKGG